MLVKDLMSSSVISVGPEDTYDQISFLMKSLSAIPAIIYWVSLQTGI